MPDLNEDDRQVVYEEQRVDHGGGELDDVVVLDAAPLLPRDPDAIEQPEWEDEDEDEDADGGAEQVDAGHGGARAGPEEQRPHPEEQ